MTHILYLVLHLLRLLHFILAGHFEHVLVLLHLVQLPRSTTTAVTCHRLLGALALLNQCVTILAAHFWMCFWSLQSGKGELKGSC